VTGAEADRLQAIREAESAKLDEAFKGITTFLNDHFGTVVAKIDLGPRVHDLLPKWDVGPRVDDLLPKWDLRRKLDDLIPKVPLSPQLTELLPTVDYAKPVGASLFRSWARSSAFQMSRRCSRAPPSTRSTSSGSSMSGLLTWRNSRNANSKR
jgi:hypothetical protein